MRVAVTGGYGFLGSHVTEALQADGHEVFRAHSESYDLRNAYEAEEFMMDARPEVVVHAAAFVGGINLNVSDPGRMMYDNLRMGLSVIEKARQYAVQRVVLIGTACSYPDELSEWEIPIREDMLWEGYPAEDTAPYGIAKLALFEVGKAYAKQYGMAFDYIIPTNLYGPGDNFDPRTAHVIPSLIARFDSKCGGKGKVYIYGDGEQTRDFLYVEDAARGIADAATRGTDSLPINLGSGVETRIAELASFLSAKFGVPYEFDGHGLVGTERRLLDIGRAEHVLGWKPQVGLLDGLERTIAWKRGKPV